MSATVLRSVTRSIIVRHDGLAVRLPIDGCPWCTDEAICSAHGAMADRVRGNLVMTAMKRRAREVRPIGPMKDRAHCARAAALARNGIDLGEGERGMRLANLAEVKDEYPIEESGDADGTLDRFALLQTRAPKRDARRGGI